MTRDSIREGLVEAACYWCDEPTHETVLMSFAVAGTVEAGNTNESSVEPMCISCQIENGYKARAWFPHLDFSGEPMRRGQFREPYPMVEEVQS